MKLLLETSCHSVVGATDTSFPIDFHLAADMGDHPLLKKEEERLEEGRKKREQEKKKQVLRLMVDKVWKPVDFGEHVASKAAKFLPKHESNIKEALERMRHRSPPLNKALEASWEDFVSHFPQYWRNQHGDLAGSKLIRQMNIVKKQLGSYVVGDPGIRSEAGIKKPKLDPKFKLWKGGGKASKGDEKASKEDEKAPEGNEAAFKNWIVQHQMNMRKLAQEDRTENLII